MKIEKGHKEQGRKRQTAPSGFYLQSDIIRIYGISQTRLYRLIRQGRLTPYQFARQGRKFYRIVDVENLFTPLTIDTE